MHKEDLNVNSLIRLDKFLWFIRIFKSRTIASRACNANKIKNRKNLPLKASYLVKIGDIYVTNNKEIEVLAIPKFRCNYEVSKVYYKILREEPKSETNSYSIGIRGAKPSKKQRRSLIKLLST